MPECQQLKIDQYAAEPFKQQQFGTAGVEGVKPYCTLLYHTVCRGSIQEHMDCVVSAIDSISCGDLVDVMVRRGQNWNLLPTQVDSAVL